MSVDRKGVVEKAIRRKSAMKKLDDMTAQLMAMILYTQPEKYEGFLLRGLADKEAVKLIIETVGQEAIDKIHEEVILLGCCMRFRDDLIANYPPAKTAMQQYNNLVDDDLPMALFD